MCLINEQVGVIVEVQDVLVGLLIVTVLYLSLSILDSGIEILMSDND